MRGRAQAALVAVFGSLLPFISPAAVALVSLRRGAFEGTQTLFWALLPMIVVAVMAKEAQASWQLILYSGVCMLLVVYGSALVLRATASWASALGSMVALSFISGITLPLLAPNLSTTLLEELNRAAASLSSANPELPATDQPGLTDAPATTESDLVGTMQVTNISLAGLVSFITAYQVLFCVVLGRWWQALLFNPGGFRQEFHGLRLSQIQSLLFFGLIALVLPQKDYQTWAYLFALPLLVVGTAVVHSWVNSRNLGVQWLVFYYLVLFLMSPVSGLLIVLLGFADSWVDVRKRFGAGGPPAPKA